MTGSDHPEPKEIRLVLNFEGLSSDLVGFFNLCVLFLMISFNKTALQFLKRTHLLDKNLLRKTIFTSSSFFVNGHSKMETTETPVAPQVGIESENSASVHSKTVEINSGQPTLEPSNQLSKRALKRQARVQHYKELKKRKKAGNQLQSGRESAGYCVEEFDQTSYYFENGLRKVYPYPFVFSTYAKGRWVGRTLKNVLEKEFGFDHPEDVDKAFGQGKIDVNNVQVSVDYVVRDCDYISHQIHRHENPVIGGNIEVLADTEEVVVINKPSSIPCHPCGRYRFNSVVFILGKDMGFSNLRNIYRLDRLTSGVLVMGKTAESTKRLEDQVLNRQVQKEYVCRVEGEFPRETLTVDQPLQALSNKLRLQVVSSKGKSSQTTFTRLSFNGQTSVVKCIPHTGRTHQIRVHLQYLGHPIMNDVFYNSDAWGPNKGKGGAYEVPHDIVCSRILQKHQATQWEGGENPLFHQKLKEQTTPPQTEASSSDLATKTETETATTEVPAVLQNDRKEADCGTLDLSAATKSSSSPTKETRSELNGTEGDAMTAPPNPQPSEKGEKVTIQDCGAYVTGNRLDSGHCDGAESVAQHRTGFDWTKWNVDPNCDLCRKLTLDPKPRDLVMFLHALKYKGPGWEYQTELPDWARDDWTDEDKYRLDSTTTTTQPDTASNT